MEVFDIYRCVDENNGHLSLIAHIRYSTSSLEYNQPITDPLLIDDQFAYDILGNPGDLALVHNGVISQKDPNTWDKEYGLGSTVGENDSELIYLSLLNNKHPLDIFPDSSMAVAYLNHKGILKVFRNGSRPLWITRLYNGFIATSTEDIIKRSSVEYSHIFRTSPGVEYNLTSDTNEIIIKNMKDLQ
jgi:predicted glutamine amidotransferase